MPASPDPLTATRADDLRRRAEERARIEAAPLPASIDHLLRDAVMANAGRHVLTEIATGRTLTYEQLGRQVAQNAGALRAGGVAHGTRVAVLLPNILEFPVTWLALARLGAVMVPVNTRFTTTELAFLLRDSGATHLVTDTGGEALADATDPTLRAGLRVLHAIDPASSANPASGAPPVEAAAATVTSDSVVGLGYTSGTTGLPKACVHTHRYWLTVAAMVARTWPGTPTRLLMDGPFFYMDPQYQLLVTLMTGAHAFLAPRPSLSRFMGRLRDHGIDCAEFPDGIAKASPSPDDRHHHLRNAWTFGLNPAKHADLERRYDIRLRESFGMTEVGMALYVPFTEMGMVGSGSCGVTAPWAETRVVDPDTLLPVEPGVVGELQVRGPGIFLGYHDRPEANATAFLDGGWFRTGDLFTVDADGWHRIVGRLKDMVRRNGENIAAREVEGVIEQVPGIAACAVVGVPDPDRDEEVKAYLVPVDPDGPGADPATLLPAVLAHCAGHLASFKIPRYLAIRRELPMTPSMKIAKSVLRAEADDLRVGSYDRVTGTWIEEE